MVELCWLTLAVAGFACGLLFGAGRGAVILAALVVVAAVVFASSTPIGVEGAALVFTMGAGIILVVGGGGLAAGVWFRNAWKRPKTVDRARERR